MNYAKFLSACGAILVASAAVGILASPLDAKSRPVVVTATSPDLPTERVSYRDLKLTLASDQKILHRRVKRAVSIVCAEARTAINPTAAPRCRASAWNGARPQMTMAIERARQIASTGSSSIAAAAIIVSVPE